MTSSTGLKAAPITVSEAVGKAKYTVEAMPTMLVTGEVSGFRGPARGGHCYFQLKDDSSAMDAIVWRGIYQASEVELRDGLQVLMAGRFQVYQPTGKLSFVAKSLQVAGEGLLREKVRALARKLEAEGLMDQSRKRPIPVFCERIAVVTSLSGSVIDDVKRTLARRNPLVEIYESGCAVQGAEAPAQIIAALRRAAAVRPDAILLVRGGGSLEDLMPFNDEGVARAVAACPVPVVVGVGHEPDTTICDMMADRRTSTPTAAAESVAPAFDEILRSFQDRQTRLILATTKKLSEYRKTIDLIADQGTRMMKVHLDRHRQSIDALAAHRCLQDPLAPIQGRVEQLELTAQRLHDSAPRALTRSQRQTEDLAERLIGVGPRLTRGYEATLSRSAASLDALSPLKVLSRGYSILRDGDGHVVTDSHNVEIGQQVSVLLAHGSIKATVVEATEEETSPVGAPDGFKKEEGNG